MLRPALTSILLCCGALVACSRPSTPPQAAAVPVIKLGAEDVLTLGMEAFDSGPIITGSVQPERRADLRAEVSAVVVAVFKENGDRVRKGELLVRLDDTAIRDSLSSAEEAARAASQSLDGAERQVQRLKALQAQGMTSLQALEDAELRRNNAQSDLVAAKARVVTARQQLDRTEVRSPFDGIVSARKTSTGDTALLGKELIQVIDPASMRMEGMVPADQATSIKPGARVRFRIHGAVDQEFEGLVRRVDPAANALTRQVAVLVDFSGAQRPQVAGLYAEGQVQTQSRVTLMLPESALLREGDAVSVWALEGSSIRKRAVQLGDRDARLGRIELRSGLAAGDRVLSHPTAQLRDGQSFDLTTSARAGTAPARN